MVDLEKYLQRLADLETLRYHGAINHIAGLTIEAEGLPGRIGEICCIQSPEGTIKAEIVGFSGKRTLLMPFAEISGIGTNSEVVGTGELFRVGVGKGLLGRVIDGLGKPLDGLGPVVVEGWYPISPGERNPLARKRINEVLPLGIKAIDGLLTCGKGQRLGIFAGSGVGKSILLGMAARYTKADISVIALIGERGREVKEFVEKVLGPEGLQKSVIIAATSDQPALVRLKGAFLATAIAEYFRDQGSDVLLIMDSVTRFAMAQREIGLAVGEPPATRGYTPSVFSLLPKLLERAGTSSQGTITGLYAVLVDGDDLNEPITDAIRGTLDGHIVLSRELAAHNHYPAIDVLKSVSRVMSDIVTPEHSEKAKRLRGILATYHDVKDLVEIGAYQKGINPKTDYALSMIEKCRQFLCQESVESVDFQEVQRLLGKLFSSEAA